MKNTFIGYYPPTQAEYERLWNEGLIVLDTNVLLNLYRLPATAQRELVSVLELLKSRLWIPYQVALEFQRRRLTVISGERKITEEALTSASELVSDLKKKVDSLQIEKRGLDIDPQPLLADLESANSKLIEAIQKAHNTQMDVSASDALREKLDDLLDGRVGVGPKNQAELDSLTLNGEDRFKEKIPPGFMDADKEKNPNEATFISDHIKYQRKFGDLILWRQLIKHAKENGIKCVLLVTADRKEDWWWREQGKTIGPHPELIREIKRDGDVDLFWMYSSVQFVEHANKYSAAQVSKQSVAEIQNVALSTPHSSTHFREYGGSQNTRFHLSRTDSHDAFIQDRIDPRQMEAAVAHWLSRYGKVVEQNSNGFPDLLTHDGDDVHGYEVKFLRQADRMLLSPSLMNSILRGYLETKEGRLSAFSVVLVIPEEDFFSILNSERMDEYRRRLSRMLLKYPIYSMVIGSILDGSFEALINQRSPELGDEQFFKLDYS